MKQFDLCQSIPNDPLNLHRLHKEDMRKENRYWPWYHDKWTTNDHHNHL